MSTNPITLIEYDSGSLFNGILHQTYNKNVNIQLIGDLSIVASSYATNLDVYKIIGVNNPNYNSYFQTENNKNSWIQFEFNNFKVVVLKYIYKTLLQDFHNKWELQGSNNNITWDIIDQQEIQISDSNSFDTKNIDCNKGKKPYSYIRLQSKGERSNKYYPNIYQLPIYGFELYGEIWGISQCRTLAKFVKIRFSLFLLIFIYI